MSTAISALGGVGLFLLGMLNERLIGRCGSRARSYRRTPNSLSQKVGLGLGAQAGEERLRQVARDAGFSKLRRASQTPVNLILELTP